MSKLIVDEKPLLTLDGYTTVKEAFPLLVDCFGIPNKEPNADDQYEYLEPLLQNPRYVTSLLRKAKYDKGSLILRHRNGVDKYRDIAEISVQTECRELMTAIKCRADSFVYAMDFMNHCGNERIIPRDEFKTILFLDAVNDVRAGNYNAMLLLGSLALDAETGLWYDKEVNFIDLLSRYGYTKAEYGDTECRVKIQGHSLLMYAKDIPHAIHILGTHMNIEKGYFSAEQIAGDFVGDFVGIRIYDTKQELDGMVATMPDYVSQDLLIGKVSDYINKPEKKMKIGHIA